MTVNVYLAVLGTAVWGTGWVGAGVAYAQAEPAPEGTVVEESPYGPPPGAVPPTVEQAPAAAPGGQYCYAGPHPVDTRVAPGPAWDASEGAHLHPYPPFDLRLFTLRDNCYYFIGDPSDFGYRGQTYNYYGAHPVLDDYGGGWCFLIGGHHHWWRPWSPYFTVAGPWYYWYGPYDPFFWDYWPYYATYYRSYYPRYYGGGRWYRGGARGRAVAPPVGPVRGMPARAMAVNDPHARGSWHATNPPPQGAPRGSWNRAPGWSSNAQATTVAPGWSSPAQANRVGGDAPSMRWRSSPQQAAPAPAAPATNNWNRGGQGGGFQGAPERSVQPRTFQAPSGGWSGSGGGFRAAPAPSSPAPSFRSAPAAPSSSPARGFPSSSGGGFRSGGGGGGRTWHR
jgi:hypothetical protein